MKKLHFKYILGEAGWATASFNYGNDALSIDVSYMRNSLQELLSSMNILLQGGNEGKIYFIEEPGEFLLDLKCSGDEVNVQIKYFEVWNSKEHDIVFNAKTSLGHLAMEVLKSAEFIYSNFGMEGYKKNWINHEFPLNEFERLEN